VSNSRSAADERRPSPFGWASSAPITWGASLRSSRALARTSRRERTKSSIARVPTAKVKTSVRNSSVVCPCVGTTRS
jgi:hypothetical protein